MDSTWQLIKYERGQQGPGPETTTVVLEGSEVEVRQAFVNLLPTETVRHAVLLNGTLKYVNHYRQMGRR